MKDSATQLLIKYKSGALVTQWFTNHLSVGAVIKKGTIEEVDLQGPTILNHNGLDIMDIMDMMDHNGVTDLWWWTAKWTTSME